MRLSMRPLIVHRDHSRKQPEQQSLESSAIQDHASDAFGILSMRHGAASVYVHGFGLIIDGTVQLLVIAPSDQY